MNFVQYAWKNLKIYQYRSVIVIATLVLVTVASVVGLSIQQAAREIAEQYRSEIGASVNIQVDQARVNQSGQSPKRITREQYEEIAQLPYVKRYSYLVDLMAGSPQLKAVGEEQQQGEDLMGIVDVGGDGQPVDLKTPKLKLIGGAGNADLPEFLNGSRKIIDGKAPQQDFEVLISEELAKLNQLRVGDSILLHNVRGEKEQAFRITGIYEDHTKEDGGSGMNMPIFNRRNELITTFSSAMAIDADGLSEVRATYEINDPSEFQAFYDAVRKIGISEDYQISVDEKSFAKAVGPINNVGDTVGYFIVIILAIGTGILILLSVLSIKERQYEIGVLRAMGMKKKRVGMSFMLESIIGLTIALVIGIGIGSVITKPVATSMLSSQLEQMQQSEEQNNTPGTVGIFTPDRSNDVKPIDQIETSLSLPLILKIAGIGFLIILLTNGINIISIMRFQPMEIMRKKN